MNANVWPRVVRRAISVCLFVEGASTGLWLAPRLELMPAYDAPALLFIGARAFMAVLQLTAGSLLWRGAPAGAVFGPVVFVSSAALYLLEIGLRLRPSSVAPGARYPLLVAYCVYALVCALVARRVGSPEDRRNLTSNL